MAKILIKRSSVPGKVPALTDVDLGEIGINTVDGKMYIKKSVNSTESMVEIGNVVAYLGYVPANKAGDTFGGTVTLAPTTGSSPSLLLQQGALMSSTTAHAVEWDGAYLYLTNNGGQRKKIAYTDTVSTGTNSGWTIGRTVTINGDAGAAFTLDGSRDVASTITLATVNSNVGTFGDGKNVPVVTVNAKGLVTAAYTTPITLTTSDVPEGTNKYYFDSRARAAISVSGSLSYNATTGVISYTTPTLSTAAYSGDYNDLANRPVVATKITTTSTSAYTIFSESIANVRGVKLVVAVADTNSGAYQAQEILMVHDGVNVYSTEYGQVATGSLMGSFDATITGGNLVATFTPLSSAYKTVSVTRTLILL